MTPQNPSDPPRNYVDLATGPAAYTDVGEGPLVLAVHGLPGSVRDWRWLGAALEPHLRFVRVDMPGFGETPLAAAPGANIRVRGDFLAGFIDALGLERPLVLGHSMGGVAVVDLAARYPKHLCGLGLLASVAHRPHQMIRSLPRHTVSTLLRIPGGGRLLARPLEQALARTGFRDTTHAERVQTMHLLSGVNFAEHAHNLSQVRVPTLVAWTEDDPLIEREVSEELYWRVASGPRIRFATGGHNLQKTRAVELAESLVAWVSQL